MSGNVIGSSTAALATVTYVPPFQPYTSTGAISYIGGPKTSSGVSTATSTGASNPTVSAIANDLDFVTTYLGVHSLSDPSYRYAYFLWFVLFALVLVYSLLHHLNFRIGVIGGLWGKYGMRRLVIRTKHAPSSSKGTPRLGSGVAAEKARFRRHRNWIWPSNAQIISVALMSISIAVFCVIGNDYLAADSGTWDLGTSFEKRMVLAKRASASVTLPNYNIGKSWWTSGARFGLIAFAMFPLVVLLALKSAPFAVFSLRIFTHLFSDKLALLHQWSGRIIWLLTTVHVVLWTVQLFQDSRGNGSDRAAWFFMFLYDKFIWAIVGYAAMSALVLTSLKSFRQRHFEIFYYSHVVLTVLTLLGSVMHYPPLWYWIAIAALLWIGERAYRLGRFAWRNGMFGGMTREIPFEAGGQYAEQTHGRNKSLPAEEYALGDLNTPMESYVDKTLPRTPLYHSVQGGESGDMGLRGASPYGYPPETRSTRYGGHELSYFDQTRSGSDPNTAVATPNEGYTPLQMEGSHGRKQSLAPSLSVPKFPRSVNVPPGYAFAQLLPSKVIRLTIRVPRPFKWFAGQHVSLYMPEITRWQSHPFSISTAYNADGESEIVLLIKARRGFTAKLFNETRRRIFAASGISVEKKARQSLGSVMNLGNSSPPPVLFRAMLDGPFGSAARGKPGLHSSILLVCGGTGVSFGMSSLESLCRTMGEISRGTSIHGEGRRKFTTKRIRFVWIVREFADIAWISTQLRKCRDMVPAEALQIDIFVTGLTGEDLKKSTSMFSNLYDPEPSSVTEFAPPKPSFARHGSSGFPRRGSADSLSSQMSVDGNTELPYLATADDVDSYYLGDDEDVLDLTHYEDEEVESPSMLSLEFSKKIFKEGKLRRAKSRKQTRGHGNKLSVSSGLRQKPTAIEQRNYPDEYGSSIRSVTPQPLLSQEYNQPTYNPYADARPRGHFGQTSFSSNRGGGAEKYDQGYGASGHFDPFASGRQSPGPSIQTYEMDTQSYAESSRPFTSTRGSMILLENANLGDSTADAGLWLDVVDYESMLAMSEVTRAGRPKLDAIIREELARAGGTLGVGTCGPASLNAMVRNTVSDCMSISAAIKGDKRGIISIFSEDYEG